MKHWVTKLPVANSIGGDEAWKKIDRLEAPVAQLLKGRGKGSKSPPALQGHSEEHSRPWVLPQFPGTCLS